MGRTRLRWEYAVALLIGIAVVLTSVSADSATTPPQKKATADFGAKQAATHKAGVTKPPLVPFIRSLSYTAKSNAGCVAARPAHPANKKKHIKAAKAVHPTCPAIFQMQRALKAAHFRTGASTGVFGKATRDEIQRFQRAKKIPPSGVYGSRTHVALTRFYDLTGRQRLQQVAHDRKSVAVYTGFTTIAEHFRRVGGSTLTYSQSASRGRLGTYPGIPPATDCSGFVTAIYKANGQADPNGFNFSPVGYTGTLALHGVRVSNWHDLRPGDLVFYGGGYPYGHVAMVISRGGAVISHGSRGVKILPYNYRRVSVIRRYYS